MLQRKDNIMTTHTETDWEQFTFPVKVDATEYSITAHVFLVRRHVPNPWYRVPWEERIDATLEGWDSLPEHAPEHEKELERLIMAEIEERYPQP
jgi:hypothetical protein